MRIHTAKNFVNLFQRDKVHHHLVFCRRYIFVTTFLNHSLLFDNFCFAIHILHCGNTLCAFCFENLFKRPVWQGDWGECAIFQFVDCNFTTLVSCWVKLDTLYSVGEAIEFNLCSNLLLIKIYTLCNNRVVVSSKSFFTHMNFDIWFLEVII